MLLLLLLWLLVLWLLLLLLLSLLFGNDRIFRRSRFDIWCKFLLPIWTPKRLQGRWLLWRWLHCGVVVNVVGWWNSGSGIVLVVVVVEVIFVGGVVVNVMVVVLWWR